MIEGEIEQESRVRHIRTGGVYIVQDICKMKIGENGTAMEGGEGAHAGWCDGLVYYSEDNPDKTFVRDEEAFREKFELADQESQDEDAETVDG